MFRTETPLYPSLVSSLFSRKKSPSSSKTLALRTRSFEEKVLCGLKALKSISDPNTDAVYITFSWLSRAVDLLSSIHADAGSLISDLVVSASEKSLSAYLDDSVRILDVCNAISAEIERLRQGRLLVSYVLRLVDCSGGSLPPPEKLFRAQEALSDWGKIAPGTGRRLSLEDSSALIKDLLKKFGSAPSGKISADRALQRTIYALGAVTVFVTGVVVASLSGSADLGRISVSSDSLWADAFAELQSEVLESIRKRFHGENRRFAEEREAVDRCVEALAGVIGVSAGADLPKEQLVKALNSLERAAEDFSGGLDMLMNGVNGFFRAVLVTKSALLKNFHESA